MIEEDTYCIDVIQQNLAAIGLIKSANVKMLESHLSCCFTTAAKSNDEARINEMI
jgi:DNA-binding FrmR family transcriptional regulator